MRTILVANPKGGSGKTMLATNLAAYLAWQNQRVLIWDLDRQKSSLDWLKLRPVELPSIISLDTVRDETNPEIPENYDWLLLDSPAGMHGKNLSHALKRA